MLRMSMQGRFLARACAAAIALSALGLHARRRRRPLCAASTTGFTARATPSAPSPSITTSSASSSRDRRLPAARSASTPPEPIRPASQAGSDPLVWDLTNTHGSRFRTVFMRAPNTPFGLELSEFFDIARGDRRGQPVGPWRVDTHLLGPRSRRRRRQAEGPRRACRDARRCRRSTTPGGRAMLVRDPDGYLVEARQAPPAAVSKATAPGDVIETSIGITVASRARAREFYETLLGFTVKGTRTASAAELRLHGLAGGTLTETAMTIPGTAVTVVLSEFALPAGTTHRPGGSTGGFRTSARRNFSSR